MIWQTVQRLAVLSIGLSAGLLAVASGWANGPPTAGLVLWLDAADWSAEGRSPVDVDEQVPLAAWIDKSGLGNDVAQSSPAKRPSLTSAGLAGKPVLQFDGNDLLKRNEFSGFSIRDQPMHIVLVARPRAAAKHPRPRILEFQPNDGNMRKPSTVKQHGIWFGSHRDGRLRLETHFGDHGSAISHAWNDQPHLFETIYEGAQRWIHYLDGSRDGAGLLGDRDFHGFTKPLRLAIGQHYDSDDPETFFTGDLAEVLVYNRALTAEEQNQVKVYLGEKWALELSIEPVPHFERDVLPILAANCHECHGGEVREGDLDLRTVSSILQGGKAGPAITRGQPEFSELAEQVMLGKMPPDGGEPLDAPSIAVIRRWIEAGAPADEETRQVTDSAQFTDEQRSFWAYQKLSQLESPASAGQGSATIDAFVSERLQAHGLSATPPANRVTLLRRASFDLIGLPPSPEEMTAFLADESSDAYEALLDRLLNSPHFGERWARSWLDWAGYVDVYGRDNDFSIIKPLEGRWRYRDYVIRAFNDDKPFDRFLIEQLAGDELVDWRGAKRITTEMVELLTATGLLLCADDDSSEPELNTPDIRHHVLQQTGEIVANNLFAMTVACAKCHNHKYEAISQLDYYRWLAVFSPVFNPQRWVTAVEHGMTVEPKHKKAVDQRNKVLDEKIAKLKQQKEALKKDDKQEQELDDQIAELEAEREEYPVIQVAVEQNPPSPTYLLRRGEVTRPGVEVEPALFSILTGSPESAVDDDIAQWKPRGRTSGRRLAIAQQITDPDSIPGALVARVFVNRLWQELFGQGIVVTSDNFGVSGARPTHPELLDWLAAEFVRSGWKVKPLLKQMMLSRVYRQTATAAANHPGRQVDPANRLLWRARLRQLPSEMVRDRILAVSGQLDRSLGGPPTPLLARPDGKIVVDMESLPTPTAQLRRSIYLLIRRNYHLSLLTTFDQPFLTANCTFRKPSAVVTQSLTMLNDEFLLEQAKRFAERVIREADEATPAAWVDRAYLAALCRMPTRQEHQLCVDLLNRQAIRYEERYADANQASTAAVMQVCHMLLNTSEFLYLQ